MLAVLDSGIHNFTRLLSSPASAWAPAFSASSISSSSCKRKEKQVLGTFQQLEITKLTRRETAVQNLNNGNVHWIVVGSTAAAAQQIYVGIL
jgi:hypothetical protein